MKRMQSPAIAASLWLALHATPAWADRGADADQLFREGVEYMNLDNCPDAIPKFLSSQQIEGGAGTLLNLGTCYARLGRTASAYRSYRDARDAAQSEGDTDALALAEKGITRLAPTLTKLVIVPPHDAGSLSLKLNGQQLSLTDSAPVPLDPGENIIEATIPGRSPWRHRVIVTDRGSTIVVEVPDLAPVPTPEAPADWRPAGLIVGGVGLGAIVAGSILAISSKVSSNQAAGQCVADHCNKEGDELRRDALTKAEVSTWVVGFGALTTAAGVALWVTSPAQRAPRLAVTPWLSAHGGAGLSLGGAL